MHCNPIWSLPSTFLSLTPYVSSTFLSPLFPHLHVHWSPLLHSAPSPSYRKPLPLHPAYSRIPLSLLTSYLWSIQANNIQHHPLYYSHIVPSDWPLSNFASFLHHELKCFNPTLMHLILLPCSLIHPYLHLSTGSLALPVTVPTSTLLPSLAASEHYFILFSSIVLGQQ